MDIGHQVPRSRRPFRRWLGKLILHSLGWQLDVKLPDVPKMVVLAAPHTSNWDFVFAVATIFALDLRMNLFAKHTLFKWPWGGFFRWAGLMPVDRRAANGVVGQTTQAFAEHPQLMIGLAPEGTRKRVVSWKSGFWQIARGAQIPIVCAYVDYRRKVVGIGTVLMPGEDFAADLATIQAFYRTITPHTPANFATASDA